MTKPHWQKQHEYWVEDFRFLLEERWAFVRLQRHHTDNTFFIPSIKLVDTAIKQMQRNYKKIYGTFFNVRDIKREVEDVHNN